MRWLSCPARTGRRGKVQRVIGEGKVIIEGLNLAKKHAKPTKTNPQGGVIDKAVPVPASKVRWFAAGATSRPGCAAKRP